MNAAIIDEPPIDTSLEHYMEERALAIALAMAGTPEEQASIEHLANLQADLMKRRQAHFREATTKRHARGEIYSKARVAAINAMGPSRQELDANVKGLYMAQGTSADVLRVHARTHFADVMVSKRLSLALMPADLAESAREMHAHEESFARAWIGAIGDPSFVDQMRVLQREAVTMLRTASRPMYLVTQPDTEAMSDDDALALGKIWNKLDTLAERLGVKPLSTFIAFDEEGEMAGAIASDILTTIRALIVGLDGSAHKIPSKKQTLVILHGLRATLERTEEVGGRAFFDVDI
jgi:hypothetical protein